MRKILFPSLVGGFCGRWNLFHRPPSFFIKAAQCLEIGVYRFFCFSGSLKSRPALNRGGRFLAELGAYRRYVARGGGVFRFAGQRFGHLRQLQHGESAVGEMGFVVAAGFGGEAEGNAAGAAVAAYAAVGGKLVGEGAVEHQRFAGGYDKFAVGGAAHNAGVVVGGQTQAAGGHADAQVAYAAWQAVDKAGVGAGAGFGAPLLAALAAVGADKLSAGNAVKTDARLGVGLVGGLAADGFGFFGGTAA